MEGVHVAYGTRELTGGRALSERGGGRVTEKSELTRLSRLLTCMDSTISHSRRFIVTSKLTHQRIPLPLGHFINEFVHSYLITQHS